MATVGGDSNDGGLVGGGVFSATRQSGGVRRAVNAGTLEYCVCGKGPPAISAPASVTALGDHDYKALARSRVLIQYRQSTKLLAFIDSLMDRLQDIDNAALVIPTLDDIDEAGGVNLDVIGELVGQSRILLNGSIVSDSAYRLLLRARITRNHAHATGPELLQILTQVFQADVRLSDFGGMRIGYAIARNVTADEIAILNGGAGGTILARPMGVHVTQQWFVEGDFFGFDDTPGALTFGEENLPAPPGGRFSEIF